MEDGKEREESRSNQDQYVGHSCTIPTLASEPSQTAAAAGQPKNHDARRNYATGLPGLCLVSAWGCREGESRDPRGSLLELAVIGNQEVWLSAAGSEMAWDSLPCPPALSSCSLLFRFLLWFPSAVSSRLHAERFEVRRLVSQSTPVYQDHLRQYIRGTPLSVPVTG